MMPTRHRARHLARPAFVLVVLAASPGCSSNDPSPGGQTTIPMLVGADISALERIEQAGGVFHAGGQPGDAVAILRAKSSNIFRLRLFVNPNKADVQVNDLACTVRMARGIKLAGARLLLDLHYSDTWADPGHQSTPEAWTRLDFDALEQRIETWSADVITQLAQANATPDIVQVGNEIDTHRAGAPAARNGSSTTWAHTACRTISSG